MAAAGQRFSGYRGQEAALWNRVDLNPILNAVDQIEPAARLVENNIRRAADERNNGTKRGRVGGGQTHDGRYK
jgi:hypothetical protein